MVDMVLGWAKGHAPKQFKDDQSACGLMRFVSFSFFFLSIFRLVCRPCTCSRLCRDACGLRADSRIASGTHAWEIQLFDRKLFYFLFSFFYLPVPVALPVCLSVRVSNPIYLTLSIQSYLSDPTSIYLIPSI